MRRAITHLAGTHLVGLLLAIAVVSYPAHGQTPQPDRPGQPGRPEQIVTDFHESLLQVMRQAEAMDIHQRYEALAEPVRQAYHLDRMIQIATGRHWRQATPDQRQQVEQAFAHMTIATYARRFDSYGGEHFMTLGSVAGPAETEIVQTMLVRPQKSDLRIDYVMARRDGQWGIIDVLLDKGVSELATKRSDYALILASQGVDALAQALENLGDRELNQQAAVGPGGSPEVVESWP